MINSDLKKLAKLLIEKDVKKKTSGVKSIAKIFREDLTKDNVESNVTFVLPKIKGVLRKNSTDLRLACVECLGEISKLSPQRGMDALLDVVIDNHNNLVKLTALARLYTLRQYEQCSSVNLARLFKIFDFFDHGLDYSKTGANVILTFSGNCDRNFFIQLLEKCNSWKDDVDKCCLIFDIWIQNPNQVDYDEISFGLERSISNSKLISKKAIEFLSSLGTPQRKILLYAHCSEIWRGEVLATIFYDPMDAAFKMSPIAYFRSLLDLLQPTDDLDYLQSGCFVFCALFEEMMANDYTAHKPDFTLKSCYKILVRDIGVQYFNKVKAILEVFYTEYDSWLLFPENAPFSIDMIHAFLNPVEKIRIQTGSKNN